MPLGAIDNHWPVQCNLMFPGEDILRTTPVCTVYFCGIGKPHARRRTSSKVNARSAACHSASSHIKILLIFYLSVLQQVYHQSGQSTGHQHLDDTAFKVKQGYCCRQGN